MNILLIEYNFFHDEVLIPQIDFILDEMVKNRNINLFVMMNKDITKRETLDLSIYNDLAKNVTFKLIKKQYRRKLKYLNYIYILKTLVYIYINKIDTVVFNTIDIYNEDIELLLKLLPKNIKKIGILHNGELVDHYYNKYDRIFVLSELIENSLEKDRVDYIYTLLYKYRNRRHFINTDKFIICIPGNIENSRRDYQFVIDFVAENKEFFHFFDIKFVFLGNINTVNGIQLKNDIYRHGIQQYFQLFSAFIGYREYMDNIYHSDLVMPLIHKTVKSFSAYKTNKISDSFNMAFSCNKPLLMYDFFQNYDEFNKFSFFYSDTNTLKEMLRTIINDKEILQEKISYLQHEKKFDFDSQRVKYLNALLNKQECDYFKK